MTPEENRRRLAQIRSTATPAPFKSGNQKGDPISALDALYAMKLAKHGQGSVKSHRVGAARKGAKGNPITVTRHG